MARAQKRIATFERHADAWRFYNACTDAGVLAGYPSVDGRHAVKYVEPSHCATPAKRGIVTDLPCWP